LRKVEFALPWLDSRQPPRLETGAAEAGEAPVTQRPAIKG
jgi:hypothetical protein